ncbi:hypothetical protein ASF30_09440 [Leifsonia sp. Leaf264]|nr:hypothetical protein ASF30_09440 [Leifsonia sp. Leaf264]
MPPFNDWEDDHTGLIHVLWAAEHENLTLRGDASDIAYRILGSRWLAAYAHKAANTVSAG